MTKLLALSQKKEIDADTLLWIAVLGRAYRDAIGHITDIYGGGGRKWFEPEMRNKNRIRKNYYKKCVQKEALNFLRTETWIYVITGIDQGYVFKMIKENYREIN